MANDTFREFVLEQLAALEGSRYKLMFGGSSLHLFERHCREVKYGRKN